MYWIEYTVILMMKKRKKSGKSCSSKMKWILLLKIRSTFVRYKACKPTLYYNFILYDTLAISYKLAASLVARSITQTPRPLKSIKTFKLTHKCQEHKETTGHNRGNAGIGTWNGHGTSLDGSLCAHARTHTHSRQASSVSGAKLEAGWCSSYR